MVAAPGGAATRRIVGAEVLRALGPDGVLVNIARGTLVDEQALIEALRTGAILAAGLDVFENEPQVPAELIALDNAVLLPHVGSASVKTRRAMADCVVANLVAWSKRRAAPDPGARDAVARGLGQGGVARRRGNDPAGAAQAPTADSPDRNLRRRGGSPVGASGRGSRSPDLRRSSPARGRR